MSRKTPKIQKAVVPVINFSEFRGKEVALVDGKVVAKGKSSKEVFQKARKLFPKKTAKEIILLSVPKEKVFIYFFAV